MSGHGGHAEQGGEHSPFDKRVAMSMVVVAALLAAVSMIGHRKHNEVLQYQGDANRLRTEAAAHKVEASNLFAWYQAKRLRVEQAKTSLAMTELLTPAPGSEDARKKKSQEWQDYIDESYGKKTRPDEKKKSKTPETLPELQVEGDKERGLADEATKKAEASLERSHFIHAQTDWLDISHLVVELGLVFCSMAILAKRKVFWFLGIIATVIGVTVGVYPFVPGMVAPHSAEHAPAAESEHH